MDTSTGHIFNRNEIKIEDIKGDLISWQVGEKIECKGCRFEVKEIRVFPEDEIVLKGIPKIPIEIVTLAERIRELENKKEE
jgi:hypothetical protein